MTAVQADIRRGDLDSALNTLQPFIQFPEQFPTLYSDYLVILVWAGRQAEATARFESLPAAVPRRAYLLRNMAKAYFDLGAYEKADQLYLRTLELTPSDETAAQGLVDTLAVGGRVDHARAALERYAQPSDHRSKGLVTARLMVTQGRYGQALGWYDTLIQAWPDEAEAIAKHRDDLIAGLPPEKQAALIRQLQTQADQGDPGAAQNYVLCLALAHRFDAAVAALSYYQVEPAKVSDYKAYWFAWSMFKTGRYTEAEALFSTITRHNAQYLAPRIGHIYCLTAVANLGQARTELDQLTLENPEHLEVLFARAFVYEKQVRFWEAIQIYDQILKRYPGNQAAMRSRVRAFSDMGASSLAMDMAEQDMPGDSTLRNSIQDDLGVDRMDWGESRQAAAMLQKLSQESRQSHYAFDYLAALAKAERHKEAAAEYERLESSSDGAGQSIPAWIKTAAAGSYSALGQSQRALSLYDQALTQEPGFRDARLGKFYVLQELRQWEAAEDVLASLENDTPETIIKNGRKTANPGRSELSVIRGWFLAEQDRLREADAYLRALHEQFPANIEARNALAHVHLWRGWPRRAYAEFKVIDSLEPDYALSQSGKLAAMNTLAQKAEAREQARIQTEKRPNDRHLRNLQRTLTVEQMNYLRTEAAGQRDDDETVDLSVRQIFSAPLSLKTRLYAYLLWRRTWRDAGGDDDSAYFRRIGTGVEHIFNAEWKTDVSLSANYDNGEDAGGAARLIYTPTDVWSFSVYGNSFSTDVSRRARLAGIEAATWGGEGVLRQSEWREAKAGLTRSSFSDNNERTEAYAGYEQNLWVMHDWRMRVFLDLYSGWNSRGDETDYFNPEQIWSVSVTHMTEQTVLKHERRTFVHRLYLTLGSQQQKGYSSALIGSLRYEHEHEFSDRHYLLVGIGTGCSVYDGDAVQDVNADLVYQWRF